MKKIYLLTGLAALLGIIAVFLCGSLLPDRGNDRLILRLGLIVVVLIAAAAFALYKRSQQPPKPVEEKPLKAGDELEAQLREAEAKLSAAKFSQGSGFSNFLTIFLLGPEGSAKTTSILQCGAEAELLTGLAIQDSAVTPTKLLNIWYARNALIVEPGARLFGTPDSWVRLIRRMMPGTLGTMVGKAGKSGRAALVCIDIETLFRSGGADSSAALARTWHDRLGRLSQTLGVSTPVYVLFTKTDRVPFFREYVQNLSDDEAHQVVGVTLPLSNADSRKPYAEEQSGRLTQSFNLLFESFCDHRPEFLGRENDNLAAASIYEFPREFRKLRAALVPFLVELCRPSQLSIGPFLRGFYFIGVRPVVVKDDLVKPASRPVTQQAFQGDAGATGMFRPEQKAALMSEMGSMGAGQTSKRVPQWLFLGRFFQSVLLEDRTALGLSGSSTKTSILRRVVFATVAAVCCLYSIALIVSYLHNRELEQTALSAANDISSVTGTQGTASASRDTLLRLDTLRHSYERLAAYDRQGPPLGLRWGLYSGEGLYPRVRAIFWDKFRQVLLVPTQAEMLRTLGGLPAVPGQNDDYQHAYDTLKTYLITTSHHEKSTRLFLSPRLLALWSGPHGADERRSQLAAKQFDLYSEELIPENPFSSDIDRGVVEHARNYLLQFKGAERVYQSMLAKANAANAPVNFNRSFPNSALVLVNNRDVPGAYSKGGWAMMQDAFKNPGPGSSDDEWVLGTKSSGVTLESNGVELLRARYTQDFIKVWREYLQRSEVLRYKDLPTAVDKLKSISGPQSPLLSMFGLASQNTGVESPEVRKAFKALYAVVPFSAGDQYRGDTNAAYMNALTSLELALEQVAGQTPITEAAAEPVIKEATAAEFTARTMAQQFGVDPEGETVLKLLEAPITQVQGLLKGAGPAELNAKGKKLCEQFHLFSTKYPFNANASTQASLADVSAVFRPKEGALWVLYSESLQKALPKQGSQYVPDQASSVHVTPLFAAFFNRAAAFSNALYPGGAADPHLTFAVKPGKMDGIESSKLEIDGQTLVFSASSTAEKQFVWPGATHEVKSTAFSGQWSEQGLWAVFTFFATADEQKVSGGLTTMEWIMGSRKHPSVTAEGKPVTLRYQINMGDNPPIFQKGYLASLACVAEIAK